MENNIFNYNGELRFNRALNPKIKGLHRLGYNYTAIASKLHLNNLKAVHLVIDQCKSCENFKQDTCEKCSKSAVTFESYRKKYKQGVFTQDKR